VKPLGTQDPLRQIEALLVLHEDVRHERVQPTHTLGRHAAGWNRESRKKAS
jgi:hypothetical protein